MTVYKIAFWVNMLLQIIIRAPFGMSTRSRAKAEQRKPLTEPILLWLLAAASGIIPLIYSVTNWLSFANYSLPFWMGQAGIFILACSLLIFWRAHYDLKANWSPSLELYEGHTLITSGIYQYIRHPMYASLLVQSIAQILLLQNWIAGPASLVMFVPFYLLRSKAEENMMLEKFGSQYLDYQKTTGGLLPKINL